MKIKKWLLHSPSFNLDYVISKLEKEILEIELVCNIKLKERKK